MNIIRELLDFQEVDANARDDCGHTAQRIVSIKGDAIVVREFLKHERVDTYSKDNYGNTALIWASHFTQMEVIHEFLKHEKLTVNTKARGNVCGAVIRAVDPECSECEPQR